MELGLTSRRSPVAQLAQIPSALVATFGRLREEAPMCPEQRIGEERRGGRSELRVYLEKPAWPRVRRGGGAGRSGSEIGVRGGPGVRAGGRAGEGGQRPSEAIRGYQRPSEAIRGHQRPSSCAPAGQGEQLGGVVARSWTAPPISTRGLLQAHAAREGVVVRRTDLDRESGEVLRRERVTQRDHLVENDSQGPEVRGSAARLARDELGSEIEGCSQNGGLRVPAVAADRGAPK